MRKKLEDWTLKEAKIECKKHDTCNETCAFDKNGICRFEHKEPAFINLTEEPTFTIAEKKFLEMLHNNGAMFIARDEDDTLYWFIEKPKKWCSRWLNTTLKTNALGTLPETMFPQVCWCDDSPLSIEELLYNGK